MKSKESLVKDLRARLEEKVSEKPSASSVVHSAPAAEILTGSTGLMLADIKQKLKQSELEKGRMKKSMQVLSDKNEELQKELTSTREEYEKSRKVADRVHGLSAALTKKDAALSAAQSELETLKKTYEESVINSKKVQRELERDIRQLQRKVQVVEQQKELLDKELDLMRINRLSASDTLSLLPKNTAVANLGATMQRSQQPASVALAAATAEVSRAEAAAAKLSRRRPQTDGSGGGKRELYFDNLVIPAALDESVQDLNDVMAGKRAHSVVIYE